MDIRNTTELRSALAELAKRGVPTKDAGFHLRIVDTLGAQGEQLVRADRVRILAIVDHFAPTLDRDARAMIAEGITYRPAAASATTPNASRPAVVLPTPDNVYARRARDAAEVARNDK
jgi:hypothetical protein